ncbi:MAG: hypothetical protein HYX52_09555 [Chloroflexi bacterium]|nr:hypothetical protein [Chloroflexota bacterium]
MASLAAASTFFAALLLAGPAFAQPTRDPRELTVPVSDLGAGWVVTEESTRGSTPDVPAFSASYSNLRGYRAPRVAQLAVVLAASVEQADREVEGARQATEANGIPFEPTTWLGDGPAYRGAAPSGSGVATTIYLFRVHAAVAVVLEAGNVAEASAVDEQATAIAVAQQARLRGRLDIPVTLAPPYASCAPEQIPEFAFGFAALKEQLGATMGAPIECERVVNGEGDTSQRTSTGVASYQRASNAVLFGNGARTWTLDAGGIVVTVP